MSLSIGANLNNQNHTKMGIMKHKLTICNIFGNSNPFQLSINEKYDLRSIRVEITTLKSGGFKMSLIYSIYEGL